MIKFFRKTFAKKEGDDSIPLKGVAKKRGKNFGFLQFTDLVEKSSFVEQFTLTVAPFKRFRLRDVDKIDAKKGFKPVKGK